MAFDLNTYEYNCYHHKYEEAARQFIQFLSDLDMNLGDLTHEFTANVPNLAINDQLTEHFLSRIISATTFLFLQKEFRISRTGVEQMIYLQRWIEMLFAASPFRNADHIIQGLNTGEPSEPRFSYENLSKFAMFYLPDSNTPLNFDNLWGADKQLATQLGFALLSPRFLATDSAHDKRELLLRWLPEKLKELDSLSFLPVRILHDVYMHSSYADFKGRHNIKREINRIIRNDLYKHGLKDIDNLPTGIEPGKKPVLLVVLEWFSKGHSIYRTHSRTIEAAKEKFHIIGMGSKGRVGEDCLHVFDEYYPISDNVSLFEQVDQVRKMAEERKPHVLYMPSIGMFLNTIFITCLRLAPLQMVALGHPATTNSPQVDYVVVEDIYVGEDTPECFSEELIRLPEDVFYRPSGFAHGLDFKRDYPENPEVVNIVMAATIMKFNPILLNTLKRILDEAKVKVHLHFLIGQSIGLTYMHVKNVLTRALGSENITVYRHKGYTDYMNIIKKCDLFLNPFPFGNTNGIVDTITCGIVGVNKTGPEVYEHIDEGLFRYLGLPDWLTCKTTDEYVAAALRLINNHEERNELNRKYAGEDKITKLFGGDPSCMGEMMYERLLKHYNIEDPLLTTPIAPVESKSKSKTDKKPDNKAKK